MREILFRGKTVGGDWIEGTPMVFTDNFVQICRPLEHNKTVIPETVGQYTGLTVPSGKIFEHDIVTAKFKSNGARFNFIVKYSDEKGCYIFDNRSVKVPFCDIRSVRVIGNTHDNPELLRKEDEGK